MRCPCWAFLGCVQGWITTFFWGFNNSYRPFQFLFALYSSLITDYWLLITLHPLALFWTCSCAHWHMSCSRSTMTFRFWTSSYWLTTVTFASWTSSCWPMQCTCATWRSSKRKSTLLRAFCISSCWFMQCTCAIWRSSKRKSIMSCSFFTWRLASWISSKCCWIPVTSYIRWDDRF